MDNEKKMIEDVALVMEGGGFRGCYTAGALQWLHDHNIMFKYTVAISATAIHNFFYVTDNMDAMHEVAIKGAKDAHMVGIVPLFTEGALAGFNYIAEHYVMPYYSDCLNKLLESDIDYEVGMYNMTQQELQYKSKYDLDPNAQLLKASCTLPISGRMTKVNGEKYLDGGIDTMISTKRAQEKGYEKCLVIVTKDKNYVRKPNGPVTNAALKTFYHNYPQMLETLDHRVDAYYDQMGAVYEMEEKGTAILVRPTRDCGVGRFSGSEEQLEEMFQLGWDDMEEKKEEIFRFLGI